MHKLQVNSSLMLEPNCASVVISGHFSVIITLVIFYQQLYLFLFKLRLRCTMYIINYRYV